MNIKFFKCKKCKKVVAVLHPSACDTICCGDAMIELQANTTDAAVEKHVPTLTVSGNTVEVQVGAVLHPMEENHFIEWIALETKNSNQIKFFKPQESPKATFAITNDDEVLNAYTYCNLHGFWATK